MTFGRVGTLSYTAMVYIVPVFDFYATQDMYPQGSRIHLLFPCRVTLQKNAGIFQADFHENFVAISLRL